MMIKLKDFLAGLYLSVFLLLLSTNITAFEYGGEIWCCDRINFYVNPTNPSSSCGSAVVGQWFEARINDAASSWNSQSTTFQLTNIGNTSISCETSGNVCRGIYDGQNTVSMASGCSWVDDNTIAWASWWYTTTGENAGCINEADICFNDDVTWFHNVGSCSGNCFDLIGVAMHEFGHWISGDHENDNEALGYKPVMYQYTNYCEQRRTLTADDIALLNWAYDASGVTRWPERYNTYDDLPPYASPPPRDACDMESCPVDCEGAIVDNCLRVCPLDDEIFTVTIQDICGEPACDPNTYIDFTDCPAILCEDQEPNWPRVYPDSCNPLTGVHYFSVSAGLTSCATCEPSIFVDNQFCQTVSARFFDNDGDLCVTINDFVGGRVCEDYNCNYASDSEDLWLWDPHLEHCCPGVCDCEPGEADQTPPINILDIVWIINYKYKKGPAPQPYALCNGDPNYDCYVDILDVVYLINYKYKSGPMPPDCEAWKVNCGRLR